MREGEQGRSPGGEWRLLALICAVGAVLRLSLFGLSAHRYDAFALSEWTRALVTHPLASFYARPLEVVPDHLPGDLWILYALGRLTWLVAPGFNFYEESYIAVLEAVPTVADLGIIVALLAIARRWGARRTAVLVALAYAITPASLVITGVWGQWDALSALLALLSLGSMLAGRPMRAMVLLTLACLVKPQFGLLLPVMSLFGLRTVWPANGAPAVARFLAVVRLRWRQLLGTAVAMLATTLAVCLPFGVSVTGTVTTWSLFDRLRVALDRYQATTLGANNLWILPVGRGIPPSDHTPLLGPLSYQMAGAALVVHCVVVACVAVWTLPRPAEALVLGSAIALTGWFLFATRTHERDLFPAVVLSLLLCCFGRRYVPVALGASALVFANVYLSLTWGWADGTNDLPPIPALDQDIVPQGLALLTLLLFGFLVWSGVVRTRQAAARGGLPRHPRGIHRSPRSAPEPRGVAL